MSDQQTPQNPLNDKLFSTAYLNRAKELLAAVAVQLETEFGVKRDDNLFAIPILVKAIWRGDI